MRVTFHEKKRDAVMETTDWLMPPRVGDQVFLIGDARSNFDSATRCFQFDAVVEEVLFFGPTHAFVIVKQKPTAMSESIPDPTDQPDVGELPPETKECSHAVQCSSCGQLGYIEVPKGTKQVVFSMKWDKRKWEKKGENAPPEPKKHALGRYVCPICGLSTPHTMATLFKEIALEKKREEDATETSVADDAAAYWRRLTKAYNKHAVAASKVPLYDDDEDYKDFPLSEAEKSWGDGGGSPGECSPSVNKASASDCDGLNPGIVKTVQWLHANGFNTCDSGDGETHNFDCDLDIPFVHMIVQPDQLASESKRLFDLLTAKGHKIKEFDAEADDGGPNIQASYDPANDIATLSLFNVKL